MSFGLIGGVAMRHHKITRFFLFRLSVLHMKLKNEAIKLENWKNEMIEKLNKNVGLF